MLKSRTDILRNEIEFAMIFKCGPDIVIEAMNHLSNHMITDDELPQVFEDCKNIVFKRKKENKL